MAIMWTDKKEAEVKKTKEELEIVRTATHRNGIEGEPFDVTIAKYRTEDGQVRDLLIVEFAYGRGDHRGRVAAFDLELLGQRNIEFGSNSWRGDRIGRLLRKTRSTPWRENPEEKDVIPELPVDHICDDPEA